MALRKEPAIRFIDMPETLRDKYQYFTEANITKLKNVVTTLSCLIWKMQCAIMYGIIS